MNWLLAQQLENGYFPRIAGKMPVGDAMVTARVLYVMKLLA